MLKTHNTFKALALGLVVTAGIGAAAPPIAQGGNASHAQQRLAAKVAVDSKFDRSTLSIFYAGPVVKGMAAILSETFNRYGGVSHRVRLFLASPGGLVREGEQVIDVLRRIRQTHRLETVVLHGDTCASMCVPIFLQGQTRFAARSSLWLFHEAAKSLNATGSRVRVDAMETRRLIRRYFTPAGVSAAWLKQMLRQIDRGNNYWQTGQELIGAGSGIVTDALDNTTARPEAQPVPRAKSRTCC